MTTFKWVALALITALIFTAALMSLKSEEITVKASFMMLACEDCYHMKVESSSDKKYVGEIIIPSSSKLDLEEIIGEIAIARTDICLTGRAYLFNTNFMGIEPDGIRFKVSERLALEKCDELISPPAIVN